MNENVEKDCGCPDAGEVCTSISTQYADISLPIKVNPNATIKKVQTECCGKPVVTVQLTTGCECGGCEITITQPVCVKIFVEYGATVEPGDTTVNCKRVLGKGCAPCKKQGLEGE